MSISFDAPWHRRGQYLLEWMLLFVAVAAVAIMMAPYVKRAIGAGVDSIQKQLNGAMRDNRP